MVETTLKLKKRIESIGNNIFATRSKIVHEDPQTTMKRSMDDFTRELRNNDLNPLLLEVKQTENTNPNDFDSEYERQSYHYEYLIPHEVEGKPKHILCHINNTTYVMKERNEYNAYMNCEILSPKALDLELMDKRTRLSKKDNKWILGSEM